MRAHFTICPKLPAASEHGSRRRRNSYLAAPLFWVLFMGGGPILMVSVVFFAVNAVLAIVAFVRGRPGSEATDWMRPADPRCRRRLAGYDDIAAVRQTKLTDNGETAPAPASGGLRIAPAAFRCDWSSLLSARRHELAHIGVRHAEAFFEGLGEIGDAAATATATAEWRGASCGCGRLSPNLGNDALAWLIGAKSPQQQQRRIAMGGLPLGHEQRAAHRQFARTNTPRSPSALILGHASAREMQASAPKQP